MRFFGVVVFASLAFAAERVQILPESLSGVEFHGLEDRLIVGGKPVDKNEIPFQISFQRGGSHFCGGAIINEKYAVSAAHCCYGNENAISQLTIVAGEHDRSVSEGSEQILRVEKLILHENYNHENIEHDICLIKVAGNIRFNYAAKPVRLPRALQEFRGTAVVSGWGSLHQNDQSLPRKLYSVRVPLVDKKTCKSNYGHDAITRGMFCAGKENFDSCQGDSGGPLVCSDYYGGVLCGIVSWGYGCAVKGFPGVYTEVCLYVDWIRWKMATN